ncbi:MAG: hypothetical protein AAGN35_05830 [Bacteroidota bacterium]
MNPDPRQSLQLAFQHLDTFSVPGIGTFERRYFGAVIDHQNKKIDPPAERFVLEKGEQSTAQLEDFYFRYFDLQIDRARSLVQEVGTWAREELQRAGSLVFPGWGALNYADQEIDFVPDPGADGQADPFFGLAAVQYTLGDAQPAAVSAKKTAALAGAAAQKTVVEPAAPVKKRRRGPVWLIVLLVLLLLGSGAGMIWPDKFLGVLENIGLYSKDNASSIAKNDPPPMPDEVIPGDPPPTVDPVPPEGTADPPPKRTPVDPTEKPGVFAQSGMYYLIVSATSDPDDARQLQRRFRKGGIQPKILKSRGRGFYKISVYQNRNKMAVINQMVEWKTRFPDKSWIYWMGMR